MAFGSFQRRITEKNFGDYSDNYSLPGERDNGSIDNAKGTCDHAINTARSLMKNPEATYAGLGLAVWWLFPVLLMAGVPGYLAAAFLLVVLLIWYFSGKPHAANISIWLPLVVLATFLVGTALLFIGWLVLLITTSPQNSPAGLVIAVLIGVVAPLVLPAAIVAAPILVLLLRNRPPKSSVTVVGLTVVNTAAIGFATWVVLSSMTGAAYFAFQPKLVKITHNPPLTEEEKQTARWLDMLKSAGTGVQYKMPIDFYGMAVDQDGKPLSVVLVRYAVSPEMPEDRQDEKGNKGITTGVDGKFHLTGLHGVNIGLMVSKSGYLMTNSTSAMINYNMVDYRRDDFYASDPDQPVIFYFSKRLPEAPTVRAVNDENKVNSKFSGYWKSPDNAFDEVVLNADGTGYHGSPDTVRMNPFLWKQLSENKIQFEYPSSQNNRLEIYDPQQQTLTSPEQYTNDKGTYTRELTYKKVTP